MEKIEEYYIDYNEWLNNDNVLQIVKDALTANQKAMEAEELVFKHYFAIIKPLVESAKTEKDIRIIKDYLISIHPDLYPKTRLLHFINIKLKEIRGINL